MELGCLCALCHRTSLSCTTHRNRMKRRRTTQPLGLRRASWCVDSHTTQCQLSLRHSGRVRAVACLFVYGITFPAHVSSNQNPSSASAGQRRVSKNENPSTNGKTFKTVLFWMSFIRLTDCLSSFFDTHFLGLADGYAKQVCGHGSTLG